MLAMGLKQDAIITSLIRLCGFSIAQVYIIEKQISNESSKQKSTAVGHLFGGNEIQRRDATGTAVG